MIVVDAGGRGAEGGRGARVWQRGGLLFRAGCEPDCERRSGLRAPAGRQAPRPLGASRHGRPGCMHAGASTHPPDQGIHPPMHPD